MVCRSDWVFRMRWFCSRARVSWDEPAGFRLSADGEPNQARFGDIPARLSSWVHMCVFSTCSSEYSLCDDATTPWQRRHIESLVPSYLAMCWKANLVVYRNTGRVWVAKSWPRFQRRNDLRR
jgi:hypothetical protein